MQAIHSIFGKLVMTGAMLGALLHAPLAAAQGSPVNATWGSFYKPFRADSPWNSRPVNPVFGTYVIPSALAPVVADGAYSTGAFYAAATDGPMTIYGPATASGVLDGDAISYRTITLPHWPAGVIPATGTDGHADIYDATTGIIHSFWQLQQVNGVWTSTNYGWSKIDGSGWGDPAHYAAGVRAVGVVPMAGIIRAHEIDDGQSEFSHALALSLAASGFSKTLTYPATLTDQSTSANTGQVPYGALLMLPPTFDDSAITIPMLKKVVATLKKYGAYAVDRNGNTGFVIYVENRPGQTFQLSADSWGVRSAQLELIRAGLRQVTSAASWVDGNGDPLPALANQNLLSWRGPYYTQGGAAVGGYETLQQAVVFPATTTPTYLVNANGNVFTPVSWAKPAIGANMKFTAVTTGGATSRLIVRRDGVSLVDTGYLANGVNWTFQWPDGTVTIWVAVKSGVGAGSTASGTLSVVQ